MEVFREKLPKVFEGSVSHFLLLITPMKYPACDHQMDAGRASVHGSFFRFLLLGLSWEDLSFRKKEAKGGYGPRQLVIGSGDLREAWNCPKREITIIDRKGRLGGRLQEQNQREEK